MYLEWICQVWYDYTDLFVLIYLFLSFLIFLPQYVAGLSFGIDAMTVLDGTLLLDEITAAKEVISLSNSVIRLICLAFMLSFFQL